MMDTDEEPVAQRKISNNDKCAIEGCCSTAKHHPNLSFHNFPLANSRFVYRPGEVSGEIEKTDMLDVWKSVTGVTTIKTRKTKICSLHFTKSDYHFGDVATTRRNLKKNAIPSCKLPPGRNGFSIVYKKKPTVTIRHDGENDEELRVYECESEDEPAESIPKVTANRSCMLPRCIKTEKDLQISTGIETFEILNAIAKIIGATFVNESEIITPRNRIILTYVKLKQNLDYSFLSILFSLSGSEQCEQVFYTTLHVLSSCFKASISLPLYEQMSSDWPAYFSEIKIVLDCMDIYMEGRDASYKVMIGSSLGGLIAYISEPYEDDDSYADIFRQSNLSKLLKPGDGILVYEDFPFEQICRLNGWKCIRPKSLDDHVYLNRFNERIKNFGIMKSVIPDRIVPVVEDVFIVICGLMNMSAFVRSVPVVEIE